MTKAAPPDRDPSSRFPRWAPFIEPRVWRALLAVAAVITAIFGAMGSEWMLAGLLLGLLAAALGVVVARTPATVGPAWAALLARLGCLVGVGAVAGGVLGDAALVASGFLDRLVEPSHFTIEWLAREAWRIAGDGAAFGVALALVVWLVALPGALWARRRGPVMEAPPRRGLSAGFGAAAAMGSVLAGCEAILSTEACVSVSSACSAYTMGPGTRAFGAAIAIAAIVGAAVLARAAPVRGSALGALGCTAVALTSLALSYTVYSLAWTFPDQQWLFIQLPRVSAEPVLSRESRESRVEVEDGWFGRVLVVHQPDGSVARVRLSFCGFGLDQPDRLVDLIRVRAEPS